MKILARHRIHNESVPDYRCRVTSGGLFIGFAAVNPYIHSPNSMELNINGRGYNTNSSPDENLLGVLRDELDLTGSKYGCGEGACGACTVLVNGSPARSCITRIGSLAGKTITTIEGLEKDGKLHRVQQACLDVDVFQCSYCASGMIMSAVALLEKNARPDDAAIKSALQGNVCRCGTHTRIIDAVKKAING